MSDDGDSQTAPSGQVRASVMARLAAVRRERAVAIGATAIGALAVGVLAVGALAVGKLAIGQLVLGRAKLRRGRVDELRIGRLVIDDLRIENIEGSLGTCIHRKGGCKIGLRLTEREGR